MENERRDDPQPEAVSSQPEAPAYREPERREEFAQDEAPRETYRDEAPEGGGGGEPQPFSSEGHSSGESAPGPGQGQPPQSGQTGQPGQGGQDRGGRGRGGGGGRRGRGRMSQRDRRGPDRNQDRNRRRDPRPGFAGPPQGGGGFQQHGAQSHPRDQGHDVVRSEPQQRPEGGSGGSILNDVRAEVERLREVLEGVLRDLEDVAEQLIKAEHEKDLAEGEIEQLKEQLRRLHR